MELTEKNVLSLLINDLQPKIRVDGGDMVFKNWKAAPFISAHIN